MAPFSSVPIRSQRQGAAPRRPPGQRVREVQAQQVQAEREAAHRVEGAREAAGEVPQAVPAPPTD